MQGETSSTSSGTTAPPQAVAGIFVGGSEEWDSWLSHFKDCSVINKWSEARKAQFLHVCMRGAALLQQQSIARNSGQLQKFEEGTPREVRPKRVCGASQGRIPCKASRT